MKKKLAGIEIKTVEQYINANKNDLRIKVGMNEKRLKTIEDWIQTMLILDPVPEPEDHRKHENPYLSLLAKTDGKKRSKNQLPSKSFAASRISSFISMRPALPTSKGLNMKTIGTFTMTPFP